MKKFIPDPPHITSPYFSTPKALTRLNTTPGGPQ